MTEYFRPLWIFISGNIALLLVYLFFPAIGVVQGTLETDIAGSVGNFWGLSWVITSTRVIIVVIFEAVILYAVARSILGLKR